jgi:antitoxin ParD1/3/4
MKVFLTPDLEKLVNERVATGKYDSVDEVVREALHLLQEHDLQKHSRAEELRSKVLEGLNEIEKGKISRFSSREIKTQGRARLRSHRKS